MILVRVEIENYKQYAGGHTIDFPEGGVVAIIGPNGAGKTTLFEAIEWCLYNPREIANEGVPSHNGVGLPRVAVTLAEPETGDQWVVERRLRKRGVDAEIYKADEPGSPIVQGTRQVTEFVARRLIGLPHKAFVSTFFTRQKELSFFGSDRPTERRREVARLLGHDTIRTAQELISTERRQVEAEATALAGQVAARSFGRDVPAEIATARERLAGLAAGRETAETEQLVAVKAQETVAAELDAVRAVEKRDLAARRVQDRIASEITTAKVVAGNAQHRLESLAEAERMRTIHAVAAAALEDRQQAVATHEAERERHRRVAEVRQRRQQSEQLLLDLAKHLASLVAGVAEGHRIDGWVWTATDADRPRLGAQRLLTIAADLETEDACRRAADLVRCRAMMAERDRAERTLATFVARRDQLERERTTLTAGGDPRAARNAARAAGASALNEQAAASARAATAQREADRAKRIVTNLREQRLDERCPTCDRPFDPGDVAATVAALEQQQAQLRDEGATAEREASAAAARATTAEQAEQTAATTIEKLAAVVGAIDKSEPYLKEARADAANESAALANGLRECGFAAEPSAAEVTAAERYAELLQALEKASVVVSGLERQATAAEADRDAAQAELQELGTVAYDAPAHQVAREQLDQSQSAVGAIAEIDRQLAERPRVEQALAAATADLARLATAAAEAQAAVALIGFDAGALEVAADRERTARSRERAVSEAVEHARRDQAEATSALERLEQDAASLRELAERVEDRRRDSADLERMQKEMSRFDQYVAALVGPILADRTGEFLAEVTDGKFNRVTFDQDYGLHIYDGDDPFPIERFSGGERDVAALCARLALSTMIGAQATNPPRFVVLDEVFGSLDEDRRAQVLGTLGKLAETSEALRQLFIISHVEDVHSSPVVSEVWRVSEADGVSQVRQDERRPRLAESFGDLVGAG